LPSQQVCFQHHSHLFAHNVTVVFVHKLHERRNEREAETADKYVEYTGHVTQRQRALRRPLQHRTGVCMSFAEIHRIT